LKRHLGEAKEQFRQQATQAFAEYQREQQSALARLAAAKQQAANA
jgi:hypothetical protein